MYLNTDVGRKWTEIISVMVLINSDCFYKKVGFTAVVLCVRSKCFLLKKLIVWMIKKKKDFLSVENQLKQLKVESKVKEVKKRKMCEVNQI